MKIVSASIFKSKGPARSQVCTSWQMSCHDICKIMTLSLSSFTTLAHHKFYEIWVFSSKNYWWNGSQAPWVPQCHTAYQSWVSLKQRPISLDTAQNMTINVECKSYFILTKGTPYFTFLCELWVTIVSFNFCDSKLFGFKLSWLLTHIRHYIPHPGE